MKGTLSLSLVRVFSFSRYLSLACPRLCVRCGVVIHHPGVSLPLSLSSVVPLRTERRRSGTAGMNRREEQQSPQTYQLGHIGVPFLSYSPPSFYLFLKWRLQPKNRKMVNAF
ncbi:hypothetical protein BKA57DRAFT_469794 [Linnemannia elongata]|nr:hypothetical protein BKA57DRAFT_469794 [Linnemannia elongata]